MDCRIAWLGGVHPPPVQPVIPKVHCSREGLCISNSTFLWEIMYTFVQFKSSIFAYGIHLANISVDHFFPLLLLLFFSFFFDTCIPSQKLCLHGIYFTSLFEEPSLILCALVLNPFTVFSKKKKIFGNTQDLCMGRCKSGFYFLFSIFVRCFSKRKKQKIPKKKHDVDCLYGSYTNATDY